ncbi:MAG: cation transporting ATPase C-terminal domain-containing protein, partial [Candidatus Poribacteria bacterium]|nr:cation transporting ATPase C-terminal domain-containing protein [Candidatus Poribacteria bacterium]
MLIFDEGDYIPADARIVEADSLIVDESPLYDGAASVQKRAEGMSEVDPVSPDEQKNMVFGGTYVTAGSGRAVVVKTGKNLELHKIGNRTIPPPDHLTETERQMRVFYNCFSFVGLIIAALAIAITWGLNRTAGIPSAWPELLLLGLGFAIASVPDGIALTARSILADNANKMLKKGVAIQRLNTLEELNNLTAVCVDEIGTFTEAGLSLSHVFVDEQLVEHGTWEEWIADLETASDQAEEDAFPAPPPESQVPYGFPLLILAASRCANHRQYQYTNSVGEDVHAALKEVALRIGYDFDRYDTELPLVDEIPETPNHPYRGFVFETGDKKYLEIILGKPEIVLQDCRSIQNQGFAHKIVPDQAELIRQVTEYLDNRGTYVLGVAHRISGIADTQHEMERNATFLGLVAFSTSAHERAKESVESCMDAGMRIVMITDKNRQMAAEIAKTNGITQDRNSVAERADFDDRGEDYDLIIGGCSVYCRLSGAQRLRIVQYLGRHGYTLGFLGRRPLDARAMKAADVGFASASHACHAVQKHADCLMLKDGFAVIETLLHHTREAYDNLRNSMRWLLSCTLAQLITLVGGFVLHQLYGLPMPLTLHQIIWTHFLVNLVPLIFLGSDRIQERFRYSRSRKVPPFLHTPCPSDFFRSLFISVLAIVGFLVTVGTASGNWSKTEMVAQTTACTILVFTQLFSNFQYRRYAWESLPQRIASNLPLLFTILVCMGLHTAVIYHEPAAKIFGAAPLGLREWQWVGMFCILAVLP